MYIVRVAMLAIIFESRLESYCKAAGCGGKKCISWNKSATTDRKLKTAQQRLQKKRKGRGSFAVAVCLYD
jgi:hypothetical protein